MWYASVGMRTDDIIHFILLCFLDGTAMIINTILIAAVLRSTPPIMKRYSALILFTALVDFNAAFMSLMATCGKFGRVDNLHLPGTLSIHSPIHVQSIGESCILLLLSFSYRLWSFRLSSLNDSRSDSRTSLFALCLLASIPAVITTITFSNSPSPPPQSLVNHPDLSDRLFSVFNMTASPFFSTDNILPRVSIGYIICLYLLASPALFLLRRKLLRKIHSLGSISDKHRHHEIFRSLSLHMCMPLTFSVGFVFWFLDFLDIYRMEILQRVIMPVRIFPITGLMTGDFQISSTFAVFSPLVVLFYLPCYRKLLFGLLRCPSQTPLITVTTHSDKHTSSPHSMSLLSREMRNEDIVHFSLLSLLDGSAIVINIFLIAAIIWGTPLALKNYSVLLLFTAIVDCNAACMSLLATVVVENLEGSIIFVYLGPCQLIHTTVCYAAQAIHVQSIGQSCVILIVSFSFRLWTFSHSLKANAQTDSRAKVLIVCLLSTIPAVVTTITFSNSPSAPTQSLINNPQLAGRLFSVFNMTSSHIISTENILPRVSIGYIISLYTMASPILFLLRRRLLRKIHGMSSPSDKHRHHMIFRSLTMQMFLPLSFSAGFVIWILDFLDIYRLDALQRAVMPISSTFAIISPIITIYFLPPYRKFIKNVLTCSPQDLVHSMPASGKSCADRRKSSTRESV
ncbi:hypothetical protein PRIPAC_77252, partial [Pristionchus pacificus]|uniref:G protein-coupled receptor n=1 Tax=Pristionchus pacificus TaxID=54126 RepID=A0A2A6C243_PRIPA